MLTTESIAKFFYLILTFIGFNFFVQDHTASDTLLWKVISSTGTEIYFLNSIDEDQTNKVYQDLLNKTEILVFEMDFDSFKQSQSELIQKKGSSPEGETIKKELSSESFQKLEEQSTTLGLPFHAMEKMEPWFISVVLQAHQIQNSMKTIPETNERLFYEAPKTGKKIKTLETAEFQINLFADMSKKNQLAYLTYLLDNPSYFTDLNKIISSKDFKNKANRNLIDKELSNFPPALYQDLVIERNKHWLPQIKKLIDGKENTLVILNPGHLQGAEGLINLLAKEGYKVEPQKN